MTGERPLAVPARAWLESRGWTWDEEEDAEGLVMAVRAPTGDEGWSWYLQVREEHRQVALFTILDTVVPESRLVAMAELVVTASFGLTVGGFELDMEEGQLRFRTSIGFGATGVTDEQVRSFLDEMARTNTSMAAAYRPAIASVLEGRSGSDAVREVEGS